MKEIGGPDMYFVFVNMDEELLDEVFSEVIDDMLQLDDDETCCPGINLSIAVEKFLLI